MLGSILRAVNADSGAIESIGCGIGKYPHPKDPSLLVTGTFVHVIFRETPLNFDPSNHEALANKWADMWVPIHGTGIDFIVDPLQDFFGRDGAWALKVESAGVDRESEEVAWTRARAAASQLLDIIEGRPHASELT